MKLSDIQDSAASSLDDRIRAIVKKELKRAENIWDEVGDELVKSDSIALAENMTTNIPGYTFIDPDKPEVDDFIAFVVDMRDSTKHLIQAISSKLADASCTKRVFYETSALLPAVAEVVMHFDGGVTEYLGDGVLALFRISDDRDETCRQASRAARKVIGDMRNIVNQELDSRYRLPALDLGVGMATSKAVVTVVGHPQQRMPKAIGECVYRASKLASLRNEIAIDNNLDAIWPKSSTGKLKFTPHKMHGVEFDVFVLST
ncbi:MAG: adenylate/guanylate cyclase domain-containing protein [Gammaproteobacteria bacterium]